MLKSAPHLCYDVSVTIPCGTIAALVPFITLQLVVEGRPIPYTKHPEEYGCAVSLIYISLMHPCDSFATRGSLSYARDVGGG
jgi:hypothetical protein